MLETRLNMQRATKSQLAELHSVMQKQWQQALHIISSKLQSGICAIASILLAWPGSPWIVDVWRVNHRSHLQATTRIICRRSSWTDIASRKVRRSPSRCQTVMLNCPRKRWNARPCRQTSRNVRSTCKRLIKARARLRWTRSRTCRWTTRTRRRTTFESTWRWWVRSSDPIDREFDNAARRSWSLFADRGDAASEGRQREDQKQYL